MGKRLLSTVFIMTVLPMGLLAQNDSLSFKDQYEAFKKQAQGSYVSFREKANKQYAAFMAKAWKSYGMEAPIPFPVKKWDEPLTYNKEQAKKEQAAQKKKLDEEQKALAVIRQQQEEQQKLLEEKNKKLQDDQQKLSDEKQKLAEEKVKLGEDRKKFEEEKASQNAELQKATEEIKRELAEQQRLLDEKARQQEEIEKQQEERQKQLNADKTKQEQERKELAEAKARQQEKEKQLKKQQEELEKGSEIAVAITPVIKENKKEEKPQPKPVSPVKENKQAIETNSFQYYGTPMAVRWAGAAKFKLSGTDTESLANAYRELTGSSYTNLLYDCLENRKKYDLCDWAYYKMLETIAESACGKGTNEAVFLQGILYQQSGYAMRFALDEKKKLHLLVNLEGMAYDSGYTSVAGKIFFLFDGSKLKNLQVCEAAYPGEKEMNPEIRTLPKLKVDMSPNRTIYSGFVTMGAETSVNKNMIGFFNDYPSTYRDNNIMTNWAYYANTPITNEVKENVYPQLRKRLGNADKLMAANMLLNWVQMGLDYAIDQKVWGRERAFFAEESLYYPLCDCEDRAILYSHLVRDLLDLDVILIYYPEHMYTAVCFDQDVKGDFIMVNGRKFTIADPTFYNAEVGKTMRRMNNAQAKVILLNRNIK